MTWRQTLFVALGLFFAFTLATPAAARQPGADPIKELNDSLLVPGTKDATEVLFPALVAMKAPPAAPAELRAVSLMTSTDPRWPQWDAWAAAETQQAVLAALKTITDPKSKYTLALRLGRAEAKPEWVSARLFIDIGEPPLIALAPSGMRYLERFDEIAKLCTIEAERLASQNKPDECLAVLVNWLRLARVIADRPFAKEKVWAMNQAENALERLGDIACSHPTLLTEKNVRETTRELDPRSLSNERVRFPVGERLALKQLITLALEERGGPKPDAFGPTLGRLTMDRKNPFDLFPQAAWWGEIAKQHAGWFDTRDMADGVLNDWQKRWELNDMFDLIMQTPTDYSKMDRLKFAMIDQVVRDIPQLFNLRTYVVTQLGGIRSALGVVGYRAAQGQWPPTLPAVQPRFVQTLDTDPWFFEKEREVRDFYRYFVPIRDQPLKPRELPKPHTVRVDLSASGSSGANTVIVDATLAVAGAPFEGLKDVAAAAYDSTLSTVDVPKLKETWLEASKAEARRVFSDQGEMRTLTDSMKMTADFTPDQVSAGTRAMLDIPAAQSALSVMAQAHGLTLEELKEFVLRAQELMFAADTFKAIRAAAKAGSPITLEMLEKSSEDWVTAATQPEFTDKFLKKIIPALANPSSVSTGPSLTAQLTEKDFILYSVGPDMKADYAKNVGRSGPDILIWPPVLTLERRALSGN